MGVISNSLLVLLVFQTVSMLMAEQVAVDNPNPPGDLSKRNMPMSPEEADEEMAEMDFLQLVEKRGKGNKGRKACKEPSKSRGLSVKQLNQGYLAWHNYYRCLHGVPPLKYSPALEKTAKANVQMNVAEGGMTHSSGIPYGENLWAMWGTGFGIRAITGQDPVKGWYDEMYDPGYDFRRPTGFSYGTGHFTQVVWKDSKKLGCYTAEHPFQGMTRVFVACNYDPPGNMNIRPRSENAKNWKQQVPPPK